MNKAEKTRQFIVEKTAPVFNEKGYVGTSLNDMTNATGLTKGSIYGNFANKDEVALAAFDHNLKQVTTIIQREMSKHHTCREKLMVYVQVYSNFQKHPFPEGGCPLLNTATEADDTHAALRQRAADGIQRWKNAIVTLIEKGIQLGEFGKDVPVEQTALSMIATIEGCIMMTKLTGKKHYQKAIMRTVEKLINDL